VVLLLVRAEEDDVMGQPWSNFLDQMDPHKSVRSTVDEMMRGVGAAQ